MPPHAGKQHSHISKAFQTQACPRNLDPSLHRMCPVSIKLGLTAAILKMYNNDALTHMCGEKGGVDIKSISTCALLANWLQIHYQSVTCRALNLHSALAHSVMLTQRTTPDKM